MTEDRKAHRPAPSVGPDAPGRPRQEERTGDGSTTEQLRADIDAGRTRDKVAYPDPAAAPLGTDAEAAGTPTSPRSLAADRERASDRPQGRWRGALPPQAARPWLIGLIVAATVIAGLAVLYT